MKWRECWKRSRKPRSEDEREAMIHVYPGMGASSSMYGPVWREQFPANYHNWPKWQGETTVSEMAQRLIEDHRIENGDVLVGSSLGGMMAGEIARFRRIECVALIGSAVKKEEVSKILAILHPLIDLSPISFIKTLSGKLPRDLAEIFADSDPDMIRAMSKAVFQWEGAEPSARVFRIHGSRDLVIPPPDQVDLMIKGGHMLAMTHAEECVQGLKEFLKP